MFLTKNKILIKENQDRKIARYFVSYNQQRDTAKSKAKSYQIISALKQNREMIIEIDSSLSTLPASKERDTTFTELVKELREYGVDYRYQTAETTKENRGALDFLFPNKKTTLHKIFAHIPDETWQDSNFVTLLPSYGIRYYIYSNRDDHQKLVEDLYCGRIVEDEKIELFDFVIYDCSDFGQMGVNTKMSKKELESLLIA